MLSEQIQSAFRNFLKPILRVRPVSPASSSRSATSESSSGPSSDPRMPSEIRTSEENSQPQQERTTRRSTQSESKPDVSAAPSESASPEENNGPPLWNGPAPDPGSRSTEVTDGMSLLQLSEKLQSSHHNLFSNRGKAQYKEKSLGLGKPRSTKKGIIVDQKAS